MKKTSSDYIFVGIQLVLFVVYFIPVTVMAVQFPQWVQYLGLGMVLLAIALGVIALFQINTRLSPFPTPVSESILIRNGVFAISRHPIYTSIMLASLGYGLYDESVFKLLIFLLLVLLFYYKSRYEERLLAERFPAYADYQKKTRRFL